MSVRGVSREVPHDGDRGGSVGGRAGADGSGAAPASGGAVRRGEAVGGGELTAAPAADDVEAVGGELDDVEVVGDDLGGDLAAEVVATLSAAHATVAVAESVTGGLVCGALTDVAGASAVVRGGVVAYATDLKAELLGVSTVLLASAGPVHPVVASMMATAVRDRLGATYGLATTGVAGPEPQGDRDVGTVYIAIDGPDGSSVERHQLAGDRAEIRDASVVAALRLVLAEASPQDGRSP